MTNVLSSLRQQVRHRREVMAQRRQLERDLGPYTSRTEIDELMAMAARYDDAETRELRAVLARKAMTAV